MPRKPDEIRKYLDLPFIKAINLAEQLEKRRKGRAAAFKIMVLRDEVAIEKGGDDAEKA